MNKVCIINPDQLYKDMFLNRGFAIVDSIAIADLVCFTGGEDVTPALYGHIQHPTTFNNRHRDKEELQIFKQVLEHKIPSVGVCRGAQFLNVACGGSLNQHVTRHTQGHSIITRGDVIMDVTSTHHQMMVKASNCISYTEATAYDVDFERSTLGGDKWRWSGLENKFINYINGESDMEVLYYPEQKVICFQPHPEYPGYHDMTNYFFSLIMKHFRL